jgi:hypothetical protein
MNELTGSEKFMPRELVLMLESGIVPSNNWVVRSATRIVDKTRTRHKKKIGLTK